jgi:hypothetical protein
MPDVTRLNAYNDPLQHSVTEQTAGLRFPAAKNNRYLIEHGGHDRIFWQAPGFAENIFSRHSSFLKLSR